jgi:hypothetical protein
MNQKYNYNDVEYFLKERKVFRSLLHDRTSNPGAYMSYIDLRLWDESKIDLLNKFGSITLRNASKTFKDFGYLSPTFTMLSYLIDRLLEKYPDNMPIDPEK